MGETARVISKRAICAKAGADPAVRFFETAVLCPALATNASQSRECIRSSQL
jgi:hypothetical protein